MERTIAIDSGKYLTKAAMRRADGSNSLMAFRTKVDESNMDGSRILNPRETHLVKFGGVYYVVGEGARRSDVKEITKASAIHKVAVYTAIALLVDSGDTVNCVLGCPLSVFKSRDAVTEYQNYIMPQGQQVNIEVDGMTKTFVIKSSIVLPEGIGTILLNPKKYGKGIVGVIDMGGLNCNCALFRNTFPVPDSMFTNNFGGNDLNIAIRRKLQTLLGTELMDELLEQDILQGYDLADEAESRRVISECKEAQVTKVLDACMEAGWNVRSMPLVFTGGTSYLLRDEIARLVPTASAEDILPDVRFANVLGFLTAIAGEATL